MHQVPAVDMNPQMNQAPASKEEIKAASKSAKKH
jgi:hypothetical protein